MTGPTSAETEHLCTLGRQLPFEFARELLTLVGTTAQEYGYTDVRVATDGSIVATPPTRLRPAAPDPEASASTR